MKSRLAVAAAASITLALSAAPSAAQPLTGAQLQELLPGATMAASRMGMQFRMVFDPSGELQGSMGIMRMSGAWSIEGDMLCVDMPRQRDDAPRCQSFERTAAGIRSLDTGAELTFE
ncbi:MAG: hypothetical protein KI785_13810 [Devosiaceae bacterium]|nr:hypothetical protein [Devosiaceae bacterium MH13]